MNLRDIFIKENETLLSTEGQQPHNFAAASQVGQGIEWPKATGGSDSVDEKRDEVEVPGDHPHHGDDHSDGVSESIVNEVGGNYLYYSRENAGEAKQILSSGVIKLSSGAQNATQAQIGDSGFVSFSRSLQYAVSGSNVGRDYEVVFVFDRGALERKYKTVGTSQSSAGIKNTKDYFGLTANKTQYDRLSALDANKDGDLSGNELQTIDPAMQPHLRQKYKSVHNMFKASKAGGEFEEVIPTSKPIPLQGNLIGFYLVPGKAASKDPELVNHPLRLNMPRPNQFVRANEGIEARLNTKYSLKNMFGDVKSLDNLSLEQLNKAMDGHVKLVGRKFRSQEGNSFRYDVKLANGDWYIMHVIYVHGLIDAWLTDEENNKIPLSRISSKLSEDEGGGGGGDSTSTVSSDIAWVSYPLLVRGRTRKEKRKNARAAVGQKYVPGPAYIGQGVFEGAFDSASPMTKDAVNRDRIRSLKNLIALYTEKGDKNRARELKKELELLVVERLGEASLSTMRDYFAGDGDGYDPSKLSQMRDYFNSTGDNSVIPDNIKRIIWKIKNNHNLLSQEFQQYKMWQQNRQKTQEAHVIDHQNVIYRLDPVRPMSDTEVLVLGGAGRYTLDGLRRKARREADELAQDLKIEHGGSFRRAAENIRQLTNTLNTIVAAYNELRRIRKKGGRGSRGITDEEANFIRECSDQMSLLTHYTQTVKRAQRIAEGIQHYLKEDKIRPEQASIIKGMFHLNTDPGYGFYRYAIHVAGNHGGDKVVLGPNAGPFAYAYTDAEEKMIKDAVKAITGREPMDLTGGKSEEPDFVNKNSTVPSIDWKKVK